MATFKYRLQPLWEQRQRELEKAEEAVVQQRNALKEAERRKEQLIQEQQYLSQKLLDNRRNILKPPREGPLTPDEVARRRLFLQRMTEELESLKDAIFSQQLVIDDARSRLKEAEIHSAQCHRAVEILEKHRAKLEKRFYVELEQKEALEQDELGNVMYLMKRTK